MDPLDFGRWQFGITTVYHFFMVPLTLGLGLVVNLPVHSLCSYQEGRIQAHDEVLGQAVPH